MPMRFRCACGQKLKSADDTVGKRARCPKCGKWLRVPESATYDTVASEIAHPDPASPAPADPAVEAKEGSSLHPPVESGPSVKAAEATAPPVREKARVVVADSIPQDLARTAEMLREHSYLVLEAPDGARALDLIRQERPDAVVVNVRLEGLSGFQVIQQLRNTANPLNQEVWDTPIMMTTEKILGRDKQYAMSLGVDGYFVKPLTPAQICAKLEKAVGKYRTQTNG